MKLEIGEIKHVQQPTHNSCVSACLAMILNRPVKLIMDLLHDKYHDMEIKPFAFLYNYLAIDNIRRCYSDEWLGSVEEGNVYLATVPSLYKVGGLHAVVFDWRDSLEIFDPNKGDDSRKYYTYDPVEVKANKSAVMLSGYILEVEFIL